MSRITRIACGEGVRLGDQCRETESDSTQYISCWRRDDRSTAVEYSVSGDKVDYEVFQASQCRLPRTSTTAVTAVVPET